MHELVVSAILLLIFIIGIYLFKSGINAYTEKNANFLLINAKNVHTIEHTVRRSVKLYPERKIYIINRSDDPEMEKILDIINRSYEAVYIIHT